MISLNGDWLLAYGPETAAAPKTPEELNAAALPEIPAKVPGNVELDLMRAGELPNIEKGNRIYQTRALEAHRWWYRRTFDSPARKPGERVDLVLRGVDCVAVVFLNGREIGRCDNMLIPWRFDVTDSLRTEGANELVVRIDSAVLAARRYRHEILEQHFESGWESLYIRKAPHMYGWDILPRIVSAGLWRDVQLEIVPPTHWRSVYWTTVATDPAERSARVMLDWDFATDRGLVDDLKVRVVIEREGTVLHRADMPVAGTHGRTVLSLRDVDLWWPRNMGTPALYQAVVELLDADGTVLDTHRSHIGFRTVELVRTDVATPEEPGEFVFLVNGEKTFMKGTNWVPLDSLHSRDADHVETVFEMITDLNCNMIRCWGGNVYEDHAFFDLCDRHGVLVWQDFAFACGVYPQGPDFLARVAREAEAVVLELRNHCSLALWAGNNENDMAMYWGQWQLDPNDDRLSREVLPDVVRRFDPFRVYLPSSPYVSPEVARRGGGQEIMPEVHLWRRPYPKDPFYTDSVDSFVSEIGFHGCPDRATLEEMLDPEFLWPWQDNEQWLTKAVRPLPEGSAYVYRIPLMSEKIEKLFGTIPDNLDDYILASQIAQAEAFKFFIEWWRIHKFDKTGILWWNLRDGWPIFSDAIVDYYNRKKLAYRYIKRVQTDVAAIVGEADAEGRHPIVVVNDTRESVAGTVVIRDADSGASLFESSFEAAPNGRVELGSIPQSEHQGMWRIQLQAGSFGQTNHYLVGTPPFDLAVYRGWMERVELLP